jgi:Chaperone of endosialidase
VPSGEAAPVISILNLISTTQPTYLTSGLGNKVSGWVSNAKQGFVFRQGGPAIDANQHCLDQGQTHLVIRENGYIGMGTEEPYTNLDIVNKSSSGKFLFNLDRKVNPALGILNLRPDTKNNYFTVGADNNHAILVTDSQYGFLFKFGVEFGTNDSQVDINQGFTLLSMYPEGKDNDKDRPGIVSIRPEGKGRLGIGKKPMDYELDIRGMTRTFTVYQDTNSNQISNLKPLTKVLEKIKLLQPITFQWNSPDFRDAGEQIGLLADAVDDVFPQVVKTSSDGTRAVAYQNLVPVLIQGLKELITERDQTRQDLQTLQSEFTVYQQQMEARLQQLADRIERCERNM